MEMLLLKKRVKFNFTLRTNLRIKSDYYTIRLVRSDK